MIFLILIVALILRSIALDQSFWLDEAINVNAVVHSNFKTLISAYSLGDFHPPLYHILLKVWVSLFGNSEISARLPSVFLGTATVYVIYLIGKKLFEEKTALIAATLTATSPLLIYYSQEARMYMMAAFFASLSVYFFVSVLKKENILLWLGFISSTALMLYSDYLPYLLLPTFALYLFFNRKILPRSTLFSFLPATILILFLISPWLAFFPKQLNVGLSAAVASPAWAQVVGSPQITNLLVTFVKFTIGRISVTNNLFYAIYFAPIALYVTFLFALSLLRTSKTRNFLFYWLFIPIILAYIISFFIPIFAYFRLSFVLGAFYLILASAINTVNWVPLIRFLLGIFLAINIIATSIYFTNPTFQRENWKGATNYVIKNATNATLVLFASSNTFSSFDYYNKNRIKAAGVLDGFVASENQVQKHLPEITGNIDKIYYFQYLSPITDPSGIVFRQLSENGFVNTSTKDFHGLGFVYEFRR